MRMDSWLEELKVKVYDFIDNASKEELQVAVDKANGKRLEQLESGEEEQTLVDIDDNCRQVVDRVQTVGYVYYIGG